LNARSEGGGALVCLLIFTPFNAPSIAGFGGIARRVARWIAPVRWWAGCPSNEPRRSREAQGTFAQRKGVAGGGVFLVTFSSLLKKK
jgi:hypothetical protein